MKHEWRKQEKELYLPKNTPVKIQMLHLGSYDEEPESFKQMEEFARQQNLARKSKVHREIYLNDARKVEPAKLKTVLRFGVGHQD
jgi:hypothetical protein